MFSLKTEKLTANIRAILSQAEIRARAVAAGGLSRRAGMKASASRMLCVFALFVSSMIPLRAQSPQVVVNGDIVTVLAGNYTDPLAYGAGAVSAFNEGNFSLSGAGGDSTTVMWFYSEDGTPGGNSGFANLTNNGTISLAGSGNQPGSVNALWVSAAGAAGATGASNNDAGGSGGAAMGGAGLWNNAPVTITPGALFPNGGVVLLVEALGGAGGAGAGTGIGGTGGDAETAPSGDYIAVSNSAALAVGAPPDEHGPATGGDGFFALIRALGRGGDGGANGGAGGDAGPVEAGSSTGALSLYWTPAAGGASDSVYGIQAVALGGQGTFSQVNERDGGNGGDAAVTKVTLLNAPGLTLALGNGTATGAGLLASSVGGDGGRAWSHSAGGTGGSATTTGAAEIEILDSHVAVSGDGIAGAVAESLGGRGGHGTTGQYESDGGTGGSAGVSLAVVTASTGSNATISTSGANAPALVVRVVGGSGGDGGSLVSDEQTYAGAGGAGGNAGEANAEIGNVYPTSVDDGSVTITAGGAINSPGVFVYSQGGGGGYAGGFNGTIGDVRNGGNAGSASAVNVDIGTNAIISSSGTSSGAVVARSLGGTGGDGGNTSTFDRNGGNGGSGGNSGNVQVTVGNGAIISTLGVNAPGLAAQSISGAGGAGGNATDAGTGVAGTGGAGGAAANVLVTNHGNVSTGANFDIANDSIGILAQSVSGAGGISGNATGAIFSEGGAGSASGVTGNVTVVHSGTVTTGPIQFWPPTAAPTPVPATTPTPGQASHGIVAQSIAGGGGAAGSGGGSLISLGGSASSNPSKADGKTVHLTNSGTVETFGANALGIMAQSIGGGGGDGGSSSGVITIGGTGGGGGDGGTVTVNSTAGDIVAWNGQSHAVVAQSVGGGGGNAGSAISFSTIAPAVAVGGAGGDGGDGGEVDLHFLNTSVATVGTKSAGLVAQSIGGGGGTGGAGTAYNEGIAEAVAVAVGGSGGGGGTSGNATLRILGSQILTGYTAIHSPDEPTNLLPVDAFGIVAQSIGGGGGIGGSSLAASLSVGVPTPPATIATTLNIGVGGTGGSGGDALGAASVLLADGSSVTTGGQGSHGVVVQSIGGGGGHGGDSSMASATLEYGRTASADPTQLLGVTVGIQAGMTVGGSGGSAGSGGVATATIRESPDGGNSVLTYGDYANAVLVQSIGGGGGNGGFGSSTTQKFGNGFGFNALVGLGGDGGTGNNGGAAEIELAAAARVKTLASGAGALVVQSIGGGGGSAGGGSIDLGATYSMGGTYGTVSPSGNLDINFGNTSAAGGAGGSASAIVLGQVTTLGGDSPGVIVQSIGGGGGIGGSAGSDASADNPVVDEITGYRKFGSDVASQTVPLSATLSLSFGGKGGPGANGGAAGANIENRITTSGDWSHGAFVQSVGGGGGKGGTAMSQVSGVIPSIAIGLDASVGGGGGAGGEGGAVNVGLSGANILTGNLTGAPGAAQMGYSAFGVLAQSVGGGGGFGADGSNQATGTVSVGYSDGGGAGAGGNGGFVALDVTDSSVGTVGEAAHALVLQSVGGTGGIAGAGSSLFAGSATSGSVGSVGLTVGGGEGSDGAGGTVQLTTTGGMNLSTAGNAAIGLLAQSVGGGGGLGFAQNASANATINGAMSNSTINLGGRSNSASATGGLIQLGIANATVTTTGNAAHGLVAQSVGGGGGMANYATATSGLSVLEMASTGHVTKGNGSAVTVNFSGSLATAGHGAFGILAQSIGGGGGLLGAGDTFYAGSSGAAGSEGAGGNVTITQSGNLTVSGNGSIGIFAQSAGPDENGTVNVTVSGAVSGGAGGGGAGVVVSGGSSANQLAVLSGGSIGALSGEAIVNQPDAGVSIFPALTITNNGTIAGSIRANGSSGTTSSVTNQTAGTIRAGAAIESNLVRNSGTLVVAGGLPGGIGTTTISGDFVHNAGATLEFNILSTGYAGLEVGGSSTTTFLGDLNIFFEDNFFPELDEEFTLITAPVGVWEYAFESTQILGLPDGYAVGFVTYVTPDFDTTYTLKVLAIPEPRAHLLLLLGILLLCLRRRRISPGPAGWGAGRRV